MPGPIERIDPRTARQHMNSAPGAMLVCAYDSNEKFWNNRLEGAISLAEFECRLAFVPKEHEIIFY